MILFAHVSHYALDLLQATPLLAVAAFAIWKSRAARSEARAGIVTPDRMGATGSHPS